MTLTFCSSTYPTRKSFLKFSNRGSLVQWKRAVFPRRALKDPTTDMIRSGQRENKNTVASPLPPSAIALDELFTIRCLCDFDPFQTGCVNSDGTAKRNKRATLEEEVRNLRIGSIYCCCCCCCCYWSIFEEKSNPPLCTFVSRHFLLVFSTSCV